MPVVMLHENGFNYLFSTLTRHLSTLNRLSFCDTVIESSLDTASCKAGGSNIPNVDPVTAGLVERLSDANPNPFTKFILILFLKD